MALEFSIRTWSAYAYGLESQAHWLRWATRPAVPIGKHAPALGEFPASTRRRLGLLGRMAVQVAWWCRSDSAEMPVVLASRYGEAERSLGLLHEQVRGNPLSPAAFGLSVHNAIGAQYSIALRDRSNYVSVAAGASSALAGLVEAVSLLADGADEVMLVCYDAPLPGEYSSFGDEPGCHYAWAWVLRKPPPAGGEWFSVTFADTEVGAPALLPCGLDALRFVLSGDTTMSRRVDEWTWILRRHG